jgi:hypothetical protein
VQHSVRSGQVVENWEGRRFEDPSPGHTLAKAACNLGPQRGCLGPAVGEVGRLRIGPVVVELRIAGPEEADLEVRPVCSSQCESSMKLSKEL